MKPDITEFPYRPVVDMLLARFHSPQDIATMLADLSTFDTLDWEDFIVEREVEIRVSRAFTACGQCGVVSNRDAWVNVKRSTSGATQMCSDCAWKLKSTCTYHCAWCGGAYLSLKQECPDMDVCSYSCQRYAEDVRSQLSRARLAHVPAMLTVKEWKNTLTYFNYTCAYCSQSYQCIEHYVPLTLGGGTTANNCVPSCNRCNARKKDKHPDQFASLFPADNIANIQAYFHGLKSIV